MQFIRGRHTNMPFLSSRGTTKITIQIFFVSQIPLKMNSCLPLPAHPWTAAASTHKLLLAALFSLWGGGRHPKEELALSTQFLHTIFVFWQPGDWELGLSSVSWGFSLVLLWDWVTVTSCHSSVQPKIISICTGGSYYTLREKSRQGISPEFPCGKDTERG